MSTTGVFSFRGVVIGFLYIVKKNIGIAVFRKLNSHSAEIAYWNVGINAFERFAS